MRASDAEWQHAAWQHLLPKVSPDKWLHYRLPETPSVPPPPWQDSEPLRQLVAGLPVSAAVRALLWDLIAGNFDPHPNHRPSLRTPEEEASLLGCYDGALWKIVGTDARRPTAAEKREAIEQVTALAHYRSMLNRGGKVKSIEGVMEQIVKGRKKVFPEDPDPWA